MNLNSLYGQLIMDHNKHPRNEGELADCSHQGVGRNPVCGDSLRITLRVEKGVLEDIKFKGVGCAISQSSASLLTEAVKGKSVEEVQMLLGSMFQLKESPKNSPSFQAYTSSPQG